MPTTNSAPNDQAVLLALHKRLLAHDPVATEKLFTLMVPALEQHLHFRFPTLLPGIDPDIYLAAVYEALTDYFKNPHKYDPAKSSLMTYLKLACWRDMQNLLRKESRHVYGRISLDSSTFSPADGTDVADTVTAYLDSQRLVTSLIQGMTSEERTVFTLMMEGERSTRVAAAALNFEHLEFAEQAKRVKRLKDRIKKRIQRRGLVQS